MLKKLREKIESKRHSKNIFWITLVKIKDFFWFLYILYIPVAYYRVFYKLKCIFNKNIRGKLPDFLIIGAQKGGTTYLWHILKNNPNIEMSPHFYELRSYKNNLSIFDTKEVHFFDKKMGNNRKGLDWYRSLFNNNDKLQGEATPNYICDIHCHEKMFRVLPKAKLILLLRNPVKRAYSAFNHMQKMQVLWGPYDLNKSFGENIENDIKNDRIKKDMIGKGLYIDHIENLLKYYPKNQLLILISEDIKKDPETAYKKVCKFLGIKDIKVDLHQKIHAKPYEKEMDNNIAKKLYNIFDPYNQRLYKFLGYTIKEWEDEKQKCFSDDSNT